jgi:hypothetical protein
MMAVAFSVLPAGTYPVHLHSRCNGSQGFHITVLQNLPIAAGGSGGIDVPSAYFDRGLCLIVYSSPTLSAVLTTRPIWRATRWSGTQKIRGAGASQPRVPLFEL